MRLYCRGLELLAELLKPFLSRVRTFLICARDFIVKPNSAFGIIVVNLLLRMRAVLLKLGTGIYGMFKEIGDGVSGG